MSGAAFLRVEKLKGSGIITVAARHNKREIQAEAGGGGNIDPARSHLNFSLTGPGTADAVAKLARDLMTDAGAIKLRKDAVRGIEAVFSLPVGTAIDPRAYFADCMAWAAAYFGGAANLLAFDVHMDEAAPHAHALILPMVGGQLNGSDLYGGPAKLKAMQTQFHEQVAKRHGLRKAPTRLSGEAKSKAAGLVLKHLRATGDAALQSLAWPTIRGSIEADPAPYLLALGLAAEKAPKPAKQFVDYVTSKGKGPTREREPKRQNPIGIAQAGGDRNPIGFVEQAQKAGGEKQRTLCSVGFAPDSPLENPAPAPDHGPLQRLTGTAPTETPDLHHLADGIDQDTPDLHRLHDDNQDAGQWCAEHGDSIRIKPSDRRVPPGTERHGAGRASRDQRAIRDDDQDNTADQDVFDHYDRPEVIDAWD